MKIEDLPRFVVDYLLEEVYNDKYYLKDPDGCLAKFLAEYYEGSLHEYKELETDMLQELAKENALAHLQNCANVIVMPETIQELAKLHKFINHEN